MGLDHGVELSRKRRDASSLPYLVRQSVAAASLGDDESMASSGSSGWSGRLVPLKMRTYKRSQAGDTGGDTPMLKSIECKRGVRSTAESYLPQL